MNSIQNIQWKKNMTFVENQSEIPDGFPKKEKKDSIYKN